MMEVKLKNKLGRIGFEKSASVPTILDRMTEGKRYIVHGIAVFVEDSHFCSGSSYVIEDDDGHITTCPIENFYLFDNRLPMSWVSNEREAGGILISAPMLMEGDFLERINDRSSESADLRRSLKQDSLKLR